MPKAVSLFLFLFFALAPLPAFAETHATDDVVQFLSNPKFTPQQKALLREAAQDTYLDSKAASFAGLTPMRFASIETETQACIIAQYIVYQDISRSKPSAKVIQFAQQNLKRIDWCSSVVRALTNQTVSQVLAYDGLVSLYYVLSRDMELRLKLL